MQELLALLDKNILYPFLLLFARVLSFALFMPIFSHKSTFSMLKVSFAFYMTIFLFPLISYQNNIGNSDLIAGLLTEVTLGLVGATLVNIVFSSVRIIGDLLGYATALSMANMFDPASGTNEGVISRLLFIIVILLYLNSNIYELTIFMLAKSFSMIHLGEFNIYSYDGIKMAIMEINRMFMFALSFAFPLFFIAFILDVYYGYGTKSMPSFSPFIITFQLKYALIFLFLMFGIDIFIDNFKDYFFSKFE